MRPQRFPVIVGPTAGGKSRLAVEIALGLEPGGEVITADAFQIYRGLDIGTAKPDATERAGVPHHLIDVRDPGEAYTVHDWLGDAERLIAAIRGRGRTPVVAGGTHLYAKALLDGLFEGPPPDPALRESLAATPPDRLRAELERVDPEAASRIHPADRRRTVRALEVFRVTGRPISDHQRQWDAAGRDDVRLVVLDWPAEAINARINARVRAMIQAGLVDEVRMLHRRHALAGQAGEALGYKQLRAHFDGDITLDEAVEQIKIQTRRFAKNQRTWLRRLAADPRAIVIAHTDLATAAGRVIGSLDA